VPMDFSVVLIVYLPIKRSTFNRVKLHEHFGNFPKSIKNVLGLFVGYLFYPFKVFEKDKGTIEIYSTMS
jgi:hypothetical protein